jgi:hypothetical protein
MIFFSGIVLPFSERGVMNYNHKRAKEIAMEVGSE